MSAFMAGNGTVVRDENGKEVVRFAEQGVRSSRKDVLEHIHLSAKQKERQMVWMDAGYYSLCNELPEANGLTVDFSDTKQYARLATEANHAAVWVDDEEQVCYVELNEEDKTYSIEIYSSLNQDMHHIILQGVTDSNCVALAQVEGVLYQKGIDQNARATLWIDEKQIPLNTLEQYTPEELHDEQENKSEDKETHLLFHLSIDELRKKGWNEVQMPEKNGEEKKNSDD